MSTKTTFKRIALVVVATLGFGVLTSIAPANADSAATAIGTMSAPAAVPATGAAWIDHADGTDELFCTVSLEGVSTGASTCTGSIGGEVRVVWQPSADDSLTAVTIKTTGVGSITGAQNYAETSGVAVAKANGLDFTAGVTYTAGTTSHAGATIAVRSEVVGTTTVTVSTISGTTGVPTVLSTGVITWKDATSLDVSASTSTVFVTDSFAAYPTASTTNVINSSKSTAVQAAAAYVTLKDSNGTALIGKSLTATITGPGQLGIKAYTGTAATDMTTAATGRALSLSGLTSLAAQNKAVVTVWGDGTTGSSTVTISRGTTVLKTFTVTFYGTVSKLAAVANYGSLKTATAVTDAVTVVATDSTGMPVEGLSLVQSAASAAADNLGAVTAWSCSAVSAALYPGYYYCNPTANGTSAGSTVYGKVSASFADAAVAANAYATSNAVSLTIGKSSITTIKIALDKSEYAPGEKATLTVTATDSNGNPVGDDGTYTSIFSSSSNLSTSTTLPTGLTTSTATAPAMVSGVQTFTVYAPSTSGAWTITMKTPVGATTGLATAALGLTLTASATVSVDANIAAAADAAAEATDAANAATDAANAAAEAADAATAAAQDAADAVAALSAQVATLISGLKAQLTALTNLVIKIQKKVKA